MKRHLPLTMVFVNCLWTVSLEAGDWPQFRYDAGRTGASPHALPPHLELRWTRTLPAPRPAFPGEVRLAYDASYEPVVLGRTMYVPSMVTDSLTALDTETGAERWRFTAEGPVRFAAVAWERRIYFVSDDGYLYCLNDDGSLRWKFRGLPEGRRDRKVLGHGRLVSLWPARGGPVLADGVVYFAAGIWPTEGVFVHALDAKTGKPLWSNSRGGHIPESNWDHGQGQLAGLTPQGYLAVAGDRLIVPCGQQLPAFLDRKMGDLATYTTGWGGRIGLPKGCWFAAAVGNYLSHAGDLYDISRKSDERLSKAKPGARNYKPMLYPGGWTRLDIERANQRELDRFEQPVLTADVLYENEGGEGGIVARDLTSVTLQERTKANIPSYRAKDELPDNLGGVFRQLWKLPSKLDVHIKAGTRLYVGGPGVVEAIDTSPDKQPAVVWSAKFEGTPQRMLAADEKLFIVTAEGSLLAYARPTSGPVTRHPAAKPLPPPADPWTGKAASVLSATGARDGYAVVLGIENGRLVEELVRQSSLHVIAVDGDPGKVAALRQRLHRAGLYGTRASALVGDPASYPFPPLLASLVVSEDPDRFEPSSGRRLARAVFGMLRPYGGAACVWGSLADPSAIEELVRREAFPGATVKQTGELVLLARAGALPGAADWSHAEGDAGSRGASQDEFIRAPMSLLWFDAAQRWHKYPGQNQVRIAAGRLMILENSLLRASDVYTGRKLWEIDLSDKALDRQQIRYTRHRQWGPSPSLSPTTQFVAVEDAIYLADGPDCLVLDPVTGKQAGRIAMPSGGRSAWANLRVWGDYLVGSGGRQLLCMNRRTGKLVWRVEASRDSLYLAVGGDKVFCAELPAPRGKEDPSGGSLFALDLRSGRRVWQRAGGSQLRYSPSLDLVVTPAGFYRGSDGEPLARSDASPPRLVVAGGGLPKTGLPGLIAGQRLVTGTDETVALYELPSARPVGEPLKWVRRGCTGTRASTHLLTTRYHGTSAWIDLDGRGITPFLGIRPGCSVNNNLYPANGVLNMPNLTAGCVCNYAPVSMACVPSALVAGGGDE